MAELDSRSESSRNAEQLDRLAELCRCSCPWQFTAHVEPFSRRSCEQRFCGTQLIDLVWQSPITEELVFRSLLVPLHLVSHLSPARLIFLTPLYFGIAHVHHFYEYSLTHPHTPLLPALVRSLVQFAYTTVFGWYATFIFLRTASLPAVILAHSYCNWCGLPRLWGRVGDEDEDQGRKPYVKAKGKVLGIGWTVAYYVLLLAGAVSFRRALWPLTESDNALATIG